MQIEITQRTGCRYRYDAEHGIHILRFTESSTTAVEAALDTVLELHEQLQHHPNAAGLVNRVLIDNDRFAMRVSPRLVGRMQGAVAVLRAHPYAEIRFAALTRFARLGQFVQGITQALSPPRVAVRSFGLDDEAAAIAWLAATGSDNPASPGTPDARTDARTD